MAKPSSVNFINKTDETVRIQSADNRFDSFNLSPGEEVRKTDSVSGSGNYDINADILINPAGRNNSEFVGNFKFDNPALAPFLVRGSGFMYKSSDTESRYRRVTQLEGTTGWGLVTQADFEKMIPIKNHFLWPEIQTPFVPGYSILITGFGTGGPNGDQKRWDLVIAELPPV